MNNYSQVLKDLLSFTNSKQFSLANKLGYDISYINKWCNGIKLPSPKSIDTINKLSSDFFAKFILEKNKGLDFLIKFNINIPEDKILLSNYDFIANNINNLLCNSYKGVNFIETEAEINDSGFIVGKSNIKSTLYNLVQKNRLSKETEKLDILITMDITERESEYFLSLFKNHFDVNVKIGLNIDIKKESLTNKLEKIYQLCNKYVNMNIQIYLNEDFKNYNSIVVKNNFVINYNLDKDGCFELISYTCHPETIAQIYSTINNYFSAKDIYVKSVESEKMVNSGYRTDFYSGQQFNILPAYGFEFLLPDSVISKIASQAEEDENSIDLRANILKLQIEWEEIFHHRTINFFLLKSSIYNYLIEGKVLYMDTIYKLSIDDRINHFKNALELIKNNKNIKIYIIDDAKLKTKIPFFNLGIYLNENKIFLKNYHRYFNSKQPYIYTANNNDLVVAANSLIKSLVNNQYCQEYNAEKLEEYYKNYGKMFLRIMKIDN